MSERQYILKQEKVKKTLQTASSRQAHGNTSVLIPLIPVGLEVLQV